MEVKPEDRGWNDPPIVNFCETTGGHKRGKLLNKRVAFPIQGSAMAPSVGTGFSMHNSHVTSPPMQQHMGQENYMSSGTQAVPGGGAYYPQAAGSYFPQQSQPNAHSPFMQGGAVEQPQPIQYHQQNVQQTNPDIQNDSMFQLNATVHNLHEVMSMLYPENLDKDWANKYLLMMQDMWRGQKLPHDVCDAMYQFSEALRHGDKKHSESILYSICSKYSDCLWDWINGPKIILQAAIKEPTRTGSESLH